MSVKHQLCITLKYFASPYPIKQLASDFGVSEGMVYNAINRVTDALLNLSDMYLSWPSPERRAAIAYDKDNPLPGCIGFIDGTKSRLTFVPEWKKALFYSYNNQYSISSQAVATSEGEFFYFLPGFPGFFHDATTYRSSAISKDESSFFSSGEYLIGDKAYPLVII